MVDAVSCPMEERIDSYVMDGVSVLSNLNGEQVARLFHHNPNLEGVVVLSDQVPVGIIMRTFFFQKLGTQYGHSLYSKRSISILMNTSITCVDYSDSIDEINKHIAMRDYNNQYDYVIVTKNGLFYGVISIQEFLKKLSERNKSQLLELQRQSEKEWKLRTSLEEKTQSISHLLNNAGQGFLSFGEDLRITGEYSLECTKIFCREISSNSFVEIICPYFPDSKQMLFHSVFELFFVNADRYTDSVYLALLPTEATIEGKIIQIDYKCIYDSKHKRIMVVLTDVTEKKKMEQELEQDRENQRLIIKSILYQADIRQMIQEFQEMVSQRFYFHTQEAGPKDYLKNLFRLIHTFKGDFAQNNFRNTMRGLHLLENRIDALLRETELSAQDVKLLLDEICAANYFAQDLEIVEATLGKGFFDESKRITITEDRFRGVLEEMCAMVPAHQKESVATVFHKLTHKSLADNLLAYKEYVQYLAEQLGKLQPSFKVTGDTIYIDEVKYGKVLRNLIHIFRNSVDHGLELEDERIALEKDPAGAITCHLERKGDMLTIQIADDGRGIALEKLKEKAVRQGICTQSELDGKDTHEQLELVFMDRLSTRDGASQISGRGMGMSSLKQACEDMGGNIVVASQDSMGTVFTISLPWSSTVLAE